MTRLRREHLASQAGQRGELAVVERRIKELVKAIADGYRSEAIRTELEMLEATKAQLVAAIVALAAPGAAPEDGRRLPRESDGAGGRA